MDSRNRNARTLRHSLNLSIALMACVLTAAEPVRAESPVAAINREAATAQVTVTPVRGGVSVLMGSGGNIAVLQTSQGKLLVDGGISLSRDRIEEALASLGPERPKLVINTHWHWDHADSNGWLHAAGAMIVAHPQTLAYLSRRVRVEDWQHTFEPTPFVARPTVLVERVKTFRLGGERAIARHYVPSHTDGDLSVYFVKADVLVTGDTYWNGAYPFIDYVAGGHIDGMIQAAEESLALADVDTLIIPGHGAVATRPDLVAFRDMLVAIRANVATLKKQGLNVEEVIAARPTADFDAQWGQFVIGPEFFIRLVYRGL